MNSLRSHWSYSAISQYQRCPLQFYFKRVLKLPEPLVSSSLVFGSAVHSALAFYHQSLKDQIPVTREQIHRAFLDAWQQRERETPIEFKSGDSRDDLIDQGQALLHLYLESAPPENILEVEQRMLVPLVDSSGEFLETPLMAVADLIIRDPAGLKIQEFKTSARAYGTSEVNTSLQATCYAHAVEQSTGQSGTVEYVVLVKTRTPKLQRLQTTRTGHDFERLGDLVLHIERAVAHKVFYPVETPLNCSGCPYRQPCREWKPKQSHRDAEFPLVELNGAAAC